MLMVKPPGPCAALVLLSACSTTVEPEPITSWATVAAGTYFSCATTAADAPYCWGFYSAAAGSGGPFAVTGVPTGVPGTVPQRQVSVGGEVACGVAGDGRLYCWGREYEGALGNGGSAADSSRTPVLVAGDLRFASVSVGFSHACAVTRAGVAYCWGSNGGGALGTGEIGPARTVPTPVVGGIAFASISAGTTQTCGVGTDGRGYCWGGGYGSVGVPHLDPSVCPPGSACAEPSPQPVAPELRFTTISAGNGFTCGVTATGAAYCWGALFGDGAGTGVLGNGSTEGSATPVAVGGGLRFTRVVAGTRAACGLDTTGVAYCWGGNSYGELGIGTVDTDAHPLPEAVRTDVRFQQLSLGEASCGVANDRALYCWGTTYAGLLGNGETGAGVRPVPTRVVDPVAP